MSPALQLTLRRGPSAGQPTGWRPVRGTPLPLDDWRAARLFTYRDGPVVFVIDEPTGLALAIGATRDAARGAAIANLARHSWAKVRTALDEEFQRINPGPKPKIKLKESTHETTATGTEVPTNLQQGA
jgi:hypothetical protein